MEPSGVLEIGVELPKGALDGHMQELRLHDSSLFGSGRHSGSFFLPVPYALEALTVINTFCFD